MPYNRGTGDVEAGIASEVTAIIQRSGIPFMWPESEALEKD
jgi:hypothetical protein